MVFISRRSLYFSEFQTVESSFSVYKVFNIAQFNISSFKFQIGGKPDHSTEVIFKVKYF